MRSRAGRAASLAVIALTVLAGCSTAPNVTTRTVAPTTTSSLSRPAPRTRVDPTVTLQPTRAWPVTNPGHARSIAGYTNRIDAVAGEPVQLYVTTTAPRFRVSVFRMGWYRSTDAALLMRTPWYPGQQQSRPIFIPSTRTITTQWTPSLVLRTNGWPAGFYLLRLESSQGHQQFVPLTIRTAHTQGRIVVLADVYTWQAYNAWGGYSLYHGPDGKGTDRSYAASFDRPYDRADGAGDFIRRDLDAAVFLDKLGQQYGLPLAWETDADLVTVPGLLDGARAMVSLGHDEYYSLAMRSALIAARDHGVNLAFLGANDIYRHIRLASTPLGPDRWVINYKVKGLDPIEKSHPFDDTISWRYNIPRRPESQILGEMYACITKPAQPATVADANSFLLRGLGEHNGDLLTGLIGAEDDQVQLARPTPRPIDVVLHSFAKCEGDRQQGLDTAFYTAASGAMVFDAGTTQWVCGLAIAAADVIQTCPQPVTAHTRFVVAAMTTRLIRAFAAGPAGKHIKPVDDLARLHITKVVQAPGAPVDKN